MAQSGKNRRRAESKYVWRRLAAIAVFAAVVAGIVLSLTVFFNIRVIQVRGEMEIYSREEISAASGLKTGGNMFRFSVQAVENRIMKSLPYVSSVKVTRKLPDKVVIEVKEADNALVLPMQYSTLVLSQDLGIIGTVDSYNGKCLVITGIDPVSTAAGAMLEDENPDHIKSLKLLLSALAEKGLLSRATKLEVGNKLDLRVLMENRIYVRLGTSAEMERKMLMLLEMLDDQIGEEEYGTLNLEVAGKAVFAPMSMEQFSEEILGIVPEEHVPDDGEEGGDGQPEEPSEGGETEPQEETGEDTGGDEESP